MRRVATYLGLFPAAAASLAPDPPAQPSCAVTPAKGEEGAEVLPAVVFTAESLKKETVLSRGPGSCAELMELT